MTTPPLASRPLRGLRLDLSALTSSVEELPDRLLRAPVPAGSSTGEVVDLSPMLDEYYVSRGWDQGGVPSLAKLRHVGLLEEAAAAGIRPAAAAST